MELHVREQIYLSGPNGIFTFSAPRGAVLLLTGFPGLDSVQRLHLYKAYSDVFDLRLFPNLKTLVIEEEERISDMLSDLLSSPESSPPLGTLVLSECELSADFLTKLENFVSKRISHKDSPLSRVVITASTDSELFKPLSALKLYGQVKIIPHESGLPSDLEKRSSYSYQ